MNRKGSDSIFSALFDLFFLIVVITITTITTLLVFRTDIDDTQTAAHVAFHRAYQSATAFSANDAFGPMPGTIDPERFTTEIIEANYDLEQPYVAMHLILTYENAQREAYANQQEFIRMEPFARADISGKGSSILVEKHYAVSVITPQGRVPGNLDAEIIVSTT